MSYFPILVLLAFYCTRGENFISLLRAFFSPQLHPTHTFALPLRGGILNTYPSVTQHTLLHVYRQAHFPDPYLTNTHFIRPQKRGLTRYELVDVKQSSIECSNMLFFFFISLPPPRIRQNLIKQYDTSMHVRLNHGPRQSHRN